MNWPAWTGVGERAYKQSEGEVVLPSKTAWDWLQLLIVPAVLAGAVTIYNQAQTDQANGRQAEQAAQDHKQAALVNQDTIFQSYLSQMSTLMVTKNLLTSRPGSAPSTAGGVLTLGFLSAMDGARKGEVVRFLFHAHLLGNSSENAGDPPRSPLINLAYADLRGANLTAADIEGANLTSGDLTGADLANADLQNADLDAATLEGANLSEATLSANLTGANLMHADLHGAILAHATLPTAYLQNANLSGADLTGANLSGANLSGADLTDANLTGTNLVGTSLDGTIFHNTTCPDGQVTNSHC